jgi:hypothetical protein
MGSMGMSVTKTGVILFLAWSAAADTGPPVLKIVEESARVSVADRKAAPEYDFSETDLQPDGSKKTFRTHMLFGSPYKQLIAINGEPISKQARLQERRKLDQEIARREHESSSQRAERVAKYRKDQKRDLRFIEEFVHAFDFRLVGERQMDNRAVYEIRATPRAGFRPTDNESQVLTGMRGTMWVDKQTDQWVKVQADVTRPVSIEGVLARVEPGTRFELEKMPVEGDVWLPKHYSMTAKAKVLFFFSHDRHQDETYFDYARSAHP